MERTKIIWMIRTLQLRNFQKHRRLKLVFSPEITTIRGRTDQGKSAILRALRWISMNVAPSDFIRHGSKFASAVLSVRTEHGLVKIVRKKGKANIYKLNGRVLKSFGTKVPDPVLALLQINEINFQKQHASP